MKGIVLHDFETEWLRYSDEPITILRPVCINKTCVHSSDTHVASVSKPPTYKYGSIDSNTYITGVTLCPSFDSKTVHRLVDYVPGTYFVKESFRNISVCNHGKEYSGWMYRDGTCNIPGLPVLDSDAVISGNASKLIRPRSMTKTNTRFIIQVLPIDCTDAKSAISKWYKELGLMKWDKGNVAKYGFVDALAPWRFHGSIFDAARSPQDAYKREWLKHYRSAKVRFDDNPLVWVYQLSLKSAPLLFVDKFQQARYAKLKK